MQRQRTDTLASRAAAYFGVEGTPHTTIKVGQRECFIVVHLDDGRPLAYYTEDGAAPHGHYRWLSERNRRALVEALS